jgi:hypothetical protein
MLIDIPLTAVAKDCHYDRISRERARQSQRGKHIRSGTRADEQPFFLSQTLHYLLRILRGYFDVLVGKAGS